MITRETFYTISKMLTKIVMILLLLIVIGVILV